MELNISENMCDIPWECSFVGEKYIVLKSKDIILNQDCVTFYMNNLKQAI